jgi:hypothetical protein
MCRHKEAVVEAEADIPVWELELIEILRPALQAMLETGATPKQIAFVLRTAADAGEARDERDKRR